MGGLHIHKVFVGRILANRPIRLEPQAAKHLYDRGASAAQLQYVPLAETVLSNVLKQVAPADKPEQAIGVQLLDFAGRDANPDYPLIGLDDSGQLSGAQVGDKRIGKSLQVILNRRGDLSRVADSGLQKRPGFAPIAGDLLRSRQRKTQ
ncbi:MAG: hypothetical protein HC910_22440 [Spirulinaceae cyanobacterium SM2_1_0]|nr:hypothetical protein [Spirulinaceae cyanobacterium SM2_1_0]